MQYNLLSKGFSRFIIILVSDLLICNCNENYDFTENLKICILSRVYFAVQVSFENYHVSQVLASLLIKISHCRAPMSFFHTTPLGRVINRLTKDTSDVDKNLADFAAFFIRSAMQLVSTLVLIGIIVPFALFALIPIIVCFYFLYAYFQVSLSSLHLLYRCATTLQSSLSQHCSVIGLTDALKRCARSVACLQHPQKTLWANPLHTNTVN